MIRDWFFGRTGIDWPRVLLATLGCVVLVAIVVASATSATAFGLYNPAWDGTSDLRGEVDDHPEIDSGVVTDTGRYESVSPETTIAFITAPDETYSTEDIERVRTFVDAGGTVVILEDVGMSGNRLLRDLGADARLDGRILRDEQNYFRGPTFPVATNVTDHTLTDGVDQLTLNYGTAVQPGDATVLIRTSEFAYLVNDSQEQLDDDNELGSYPVATVEESGNGEIVVVGDPSIAINSMFGEPDNAAFLAELYTQNDTERVLFDISHNEGLPPLITVLIAFRESAALQIVSGSVGILGFAFLSRRRVRPVLSHVADRSFLNQFRIGGRQETHLGPTMSDEQRATYLRQRHPDWDETRIQRVSTGLNRTDVKEEDTSNQ